MMKKQKKRKKMKKLLKKIKLEMKIIILNKLK